MYAYYVYEAMLLQLDYAQIAEGFAAALVVELQRSMLQL
jgi:hypothetical protein